MKYIFLFILNIGIAQAMDQIKGRVIKKEGEWEYLAHLMGGRMVHAFIDAKGKKNMNMFVVKSKDKADVIAIKDDRTKEAYFDFLHNEYEKEQQSKNSSDK